MIRVYAHGVVHLSVCVPAEMTREAIAQEVNSRYPTGISSQWEISEEPFRTGESNPCVCNEDKSRKHYLMVC